MCIGLYIKLNEKIFLVKNRDRSYKPDIKIIHEILNGVEIAYILDMSSLWVEGLNEYGYGIINTTMNFSYDKSVEETKINDTNKLSKDLYLSILTENESNKIIDRLISPIFFENPTFEGHTIVANSSINESFAFHLESKKNYSMGNENIGLKNYFSVTNHGLLLNKFGGINKNILFSSIKRKLLVDLEIDDILYSAKTIWDIKSSMNKNYSKLDNKSNIYRENIPGKNEVFTTGQIGLNLTDKILNYSYDENNSNFIGIETNLPELYEPKIKIIVKSTQKNKIDSKFNGII